MLKRHDYMQLDILSAFSTWLAVAMSTSWIWYQQHGLDQRLWIGAGLFSSFWVGFHCTVSSEKTNFTAPQRLTYSAMFACVCGLYFTFPIHSVGILAVICSALLSYAAPRPIAFLIIPLSTIPFFVSRSWYWGHDDNVITILLYMMFQLFAFMTFERMRTAEAAERHAKQLNQELRATQQLVKVVSQQAERLRISRDLHDVLGHHLTALTINLQVASHLTEGEAKEKVEQSHAIAKLLLSDVRDAVSTLREDAVIDLPAAITELVSAISKPHIQLTLDSQVAIYDVRIAEALFRCIQEALTNILKHSNATQCQILLTQTHSHILLQINDNGSTAHTDSLTAGNGLTGMKERIQAIGGDVNWQADTRGFQINIAVNDPQT